MDDLAVILLVEDLEGDIEIIKRSFARAGLTNPMHVVRDGEQAIAYLLGEGPYSNRAEHPLPDLILLDLKLPRIDGFEVLEWLRSHPSLRSIPVLVLTSSDQMKDVNRAYDLGAIKFLVKPLDFEQFVGTSEVLKKYWLKTARVPDAQRRPPASRSWPKKPTDPSC
jgi:CheY-like chemotaxis protein